MFVAFNIFPFNMLFHDTCRIDKFTIKLSFHQLFKLLLVVSHQLFKLVVGEVTNWKLFLIYDEISTFHLLLAKVTNWKLFLMEHLFIFQWQLFHPIQFLKYWCHLTTRDVACYVAICQVVKLMPTIFVTFITVRSYCAIACISTENFSLEFQKSTSWSSWAGFF